MIQLFRAAQIVGWGVTGENLQPLPPFLMSLHHSIEGQMYPPLLGIKRKRLVTMGEDMFSIKFVYT